MDDVHPRWNELRLALRGRRSQMYVRLPIPFALLWGEAHICRDIGASRAWLVIEPDDADLSAAVSDSVDCVSGVIEVPA